MPDQEIPFYLAQLGPLTPAQAQSFAADGVRLRMRRRWERRRAATAGHTALSIVADSSTSARPHRRAATAEDTRKCLASPGFARRRFAEIEKVAR